jgi:hypothetical protein
MPYVLYVSRVSKADLSALENLFSTVGDVKSCHVQLIPESGHQSEFGVFEMETEQQTYDCAERFNGYCFCEGRNLSVVTQRPVAKSPSKTKEERSNARRKM